MSLLKSISLNIAQKLKDLDYRRAFFEDWANDEVADQIRRMRKLRNLRQVDVADATGMKQSAVSRIEQSEYSRWNFVTILRIAEALDARVRVVLEPAEEVIAQYEYTERLSQEGTPLGIERAHSQARWSVDVVRQRESELRGIKVISPETRQRSPVSPQAVIRSALERGAL